jgi:hypothetical protein
MDTWGNWKLIKTGFWFGVGFIAPLLIALHISNIVAMMAMPLMIESPFEPDEMSAIDMISGMNRTDYITINEYKEKPIGDRLLILGVIENTGDKKVSSIQLEAELLNESGEFVYECSEYINSDLHPGDKENFQIRCGCNGQTIPEHSKVTVRVVSASIY